MGCNHVWRVEEGLQQYSLEKRIKMIPKNQYCWLRAGEQVGNYEVCPVCNEAVRIAQTKLGDTNEK